MTDRIDEQLETFYAHIAQQPLTPTLEHMTMHRFKERAARRLIATFATGALVVAVAIAAAVVGLAAHLGRVTSGHAVPQGTNAPGPAAQVSSQPTPSMPTTTVTFTGAVSGTLRVTSTVCSPGFPAASPSPGQPAPGQVPALSATEQATLAAYIPGREMPLSLSVTDAVVLSPRADATILVIRAGQTTKQALRRARDILTQVNAHVAGALLNAVDLTSPDYYYYYEYQGKYGHRYYDEKMETEKDSVRAVSSGA